LFPINVKSLKGVTQDSRKVKEGYLFAALKGELVDGRDFIDDAIKRGAAVILSYEGTKIDGNISSILVENPRKMFAHIVSEFYQNQPDNIVAVTGTNGKSSVVHFVDQLWRSIGEQSAFIGTLSGSMTTPDPVSLHKILSHMSDDGVNSVAIEASSHGLAQYRIDGVNVDVAAFTNLTQDHLDYHGSMDDYLASKTRLFSDILEQDGVAVLNADIAQYQELVDICDRHILSYGENGADIKLRSVLAVGAFQHVEIEVMGNSYGINLPLVGKFQVMNALCALACVIATFPDKAGELVAALERLEPVPGRLQQVGGNAYVDYAHTPDALENVLNALRAHCLGKLICVFGCGGDRDAGKRELMGAVAGRLADIVIVTDDNPRSEKPSDIRKEILSGINKDTDIHEIASRREAIEFAVNLMDEEDILLVAGKGHEQGQVFDGFIEPFDDVFEVKKLLS